MTSPQETFVATWHQYHFAYHPRARCRAEETSHLVSIAESIYVELNEIECSRDYLNSTSLDVLKFKDRGLGGLSTL